MKQFKSDDRNEKGQELIPAQRDGEEATLQPAFEGINGAQRMSRRRLLQLTGGSLAGGAIAVTSGLNIGTKQAQAECLWNTGMNGIANFTNFRIVVLNQENRKFRTLVPHTWTSFGDELIPWCEDIWEVQRKAYSFYPGGYDPAAPPAFYVFQYFISHEIHWMPGDLPSDRAELRKRWSERKRVGPFPSSYVDVHIRYDEGSKKYEIDGVTK
jgi:hypothetical protein